MTRCPSVISCGWNLVQCDQDERHRGVHCALSWPVDLVWYESPLDRLRGVGVLAGLLARQLGAGVEPAELVLLSAEFAWRRELGAWRRRLARRRR